MEVRTLQRLRDLPAGTWERLEPRGNPFAGPAFLETLEDTGCVGPGTGWNPAHQVLYRDGEPLGLLPAYLKDHSFGEYVFDWAWADAWARNGLSYYPKLVTAIPFTPSVGPRLLLSAGTDPQAAGAALLEQIEKDGETGGYSSWHLLFPDPPSLDAFAGRQGLSRRLGCQFRWYNRGYASWEDFLGALRSRKRKMIRRERARVAEQGIELRWRSGAELDARSLSVFFRFYQATYLKHGQFPYLNEAFFQRLRERCPDQLALVMAHEGTKPVAAALFLHDDEGLYGRYWGCLEEYDRLHFEACYYQGIDFCIARGLRFFDAGAQGEHKLLRGFEPVLTPSLHWIRDPRFAEAVADFVAREARQVRQMADSAAEYLPYRSHT